MNINKKYAVFGAAAVIAVAGVIYFGTSANQQASVANLGNNLSGPVIPIDEPTTPPTPVVTEFQWRKLCRDGAPHIQVLSPNGGEVYQAGQQVNVKWKSCNNDKSSKVIINTVKFSANNEFALMPTNHIVGEAPNVTQNDGTEIVTIPNTSLYNYSNFQYGTDFKLRIYLSPTAGTYQGVTYDLSDDTFTINQASTAKLKLSEDVNNPKDRSVVVNYTNTTNDVSMLKFNLKAEGSDLNIRKIALPATATGVTSASKISTYYKLKYNGAIISSYAPAIGGNATPTITFGDSSVAGSMPLNGGLGRITITKDTTASFEITADINTISQGRGSATNFDDGDTLKIEFPASTLQSSAVTVFDQNGDPIGTSATNRMGSVIGYNATFHTQGISTTLNSAPSPVSTVNTSGAVTSAMYRIRLNVTATGNDFWIPRGAAFIRGTNTTTVPNLTSPQNGISFGILDGSNTYVDGSTAGNISTPASEISSSVSLISGAVIDVSGRIKIPAGQTAVLELLVNISEGVTSQDVVGQYKVGVLSVNGADTSTGAITNYNTTPVGNYQTPFNTPAFQ